VKPDVTEGARKLLEALDSSERPAHLASLTPEQEVIMSMQAQDLLDADQEIKALEARIEALIKSWT